MPESKLHVLRVIADNQVLFDTLKEIISNEFLFTNTDKLETNISNEALGEKVRARIQGLASVENAFLKIAQTKTGYIAPQSINRAR